MGRFARLIEQSNPDAPRYIANTGKYVLSDALEAAGIDVEVKDFHPELHFTVDGVRYKVTISEDSSVKGEEEEGVTNQQDALSPEDEKAIKVAKEFASKPKGGIMGMNTPQGKMDKAYGDMMGKVSQKISNIARKI